jgi:hypothetical protein
VPLPAGSHSISYHVTQYGDDLSISLSVPFAIDSNTPATSVDAAAEAAMEAFVSTLQQLNPDYPVSARRTYHCQQDGDPWTPPQPDGGQA